MKYQQKRFSVGGRSKQYENNYDAVFGKDESMVTIKACRCPDSSAPHRIDRSSGRVRLFCTVCGDEVTV